MFKALFLNIISPILLLLWVFVQNPDNGTGKAYRCIEKFEYIDTASPYAKMGDYSVGKFQVQRKYLPHDVFVEETHGIDLLKSNNGNGKMYSLDTFKLINKDWYQVYMSKRNVVFSEELFMQKQPTKLYYSWLVENNKVLMKHDTLAMAGDTIIENAAETYFYILKPVRTVRLNGMLCYEYTKLDGKNNMQPMGRLFFNFEKGVVRFESAGDPYAIFDMINFVQGPGCREQTIETDSD